MAKKQTGFRLLTPEQRKERARKGGLKVSQDKEHMWQLGRKGGLKVSQDKEHMREIGRKGKLAQIRSKEDQLKRDIGLDPGDDTGGEF